MRPDDLSGIDDARKDPRNAPPKRDCNHGQLARSCAICEVEQQRDELLEALRKINSTSPRLGGLDNPTEFAISDARAWCISDMKSIARKAIAKARQQ